MIAPVPVNLNEVMLEKAGLNHSMGLVAQGNKNFAWVQLDFRM